MTNRKLKKMAKKNQPSFDKWYDKNSSRIDGLEQFPSEKPSYAKVLSFCIFPSAALLVCLCLLLWLVFLPKQIVIGRYGDNEIHYQTINFEELSAHNIYLPNCSDLTNESYQAAYLNENNKLALLKIKGDYLNITDSPSTDNLYRLSITILLEERLDFKGYENYSNLSETLSIANRSFKYAFVAFDGEYFNYYALTTIDSNKYFISCAMLSNTKLEFILNLLFA